MGCAISSQQHELQDLERGKTPACILHFTGDSERRQPQIELPTLATAFQEIRDHAQCPSRPFEAIVIFEVVIVTPGRFTLPCSMNWDIPS